MSVARAQAAEAVESHVREFFEGHTVEVVEYDLGPGRREVLADLRVLVVGPGPHSDCWVYVTAGCWSAMEKRGHGGTTGRQVRGGSLPFEGSNTQLHHYSG